MKLIVHRASYGFLHVWFLPGAISNYSRSPTNYLTLAKVGDPWFHSTAIVVCKHLVNR